MEEKKLHTEKTLTPSALGRVGLDDVPHRWDMIIIGGGITGAGILREAARAGLSALLLERSDFAWGTSSRSSKLVHGGLRYLKEGRLLLTKTAVEERERLLAEAPGLVEPLGFLMPLYKHQSPGKIILGAGLTLYDFMAAETHHRFFEREEFSTLLPRVKKRNLTGGYRFFDAQVDDARLVLRLMHEAVAEGACALNYVAAREILRNVRGKTVGVAAEQSGTSKNKNFFAPVIINATGAWAEALHRSPDAAVHLRPLRGSHIVFPAWRLPIAQAVSVIHPADNRPVFMIPWEGAVLVGTTDLDHEQDLSAEPAATDEEINYLIEGLREYFPSISTDPENAICTFAGVRPVLSEGKHPPSEESRDHVVWVDRGLVTVTGGKLTTFRRLALGALKAAEPFLPGGITLDRTAPVFSPPPKIPADCHGLTPQVWRRLAGRYGDGARTLVQNVAPEDLQTIPGTATIWAEIPFVSRYEGIRHLDDLLLRRLRLGLLLPEGATEQLDKIRALCKSVLPWDKKRWRDEERRYREILRQAYRPPGKPASPPADGIQILTEKLHVFLKKMLPGR